MVNKNFQSTPKSSRVVSTNAVVTIEIRLRFNGRSTGVRLLIKGHNDVVR